MPFGSGELEGSFSKGRGVVCQACSSKWDWRWELDWDLNWHCWDEAGERLGRSFVVGLVFDCCYYGLLGVES